MKLYIRNSTLHRIFFLVIIQHNNHCKYYQQLRVYKLPSLSNRHPYFTHPIILIFQASRTTMTLSNLEIRRSRACQCMVDCLGWAAAEAEVGVKQGYESIALYGESVGDVLVNVIMSSTLNTEMESKKAPEAPKRQNEDEREGMCIITTKLMDWENRLVFLLFISSSFDSICFCGRTLCAQTGASISSSSVFYYPGTNPFTLH
jgi:hypothetical protein